MLIRRPFYHHKDTCDAFVFPCEPEIEREQLEVFEKSIGKCWAVG